MTVKSDVITALVGITVYPGAAPQDAAKPFVVYKVAPNVPVTTIHGTTPITGHEFTFECWAASALAAETLAASVRAAIDSSTLVAERIPAPEDGYDPEVDEYVEPVAYRIWKQ